MKRIHDSRSRLMLALTLLAILFATGCPRTSKTDPAVQERPTANNDGAVGNKIPTDRTQAKQQGKVEDKTEKSHSSKPVKLASHKPGATNDRQEVDKQTKVKSHEKLFENWPRPTLALFVTGRQHGYLEPCGCTGLENQKGGLVRRQAFQKSLIEQGWPLVPLDVGNHVRRSGRQAEIKFQTTINSLKKMKYAAIGLGPDDLRLSEVGSFTVSTPEDPSPIICANAAVYSPELTRQFHIATAGDKKIGITAILGAKHQEKIVNEFVVFSSPDEGLKKVWPKLQGENCDLYVLLAHTSIEESKELARKYPHFDVVVTAGGAGDPPRVAEKIEETKSWLIEVGTKGMFVGVIGLFDNDEHRLRYQRVPLDDRFNDEDAPDMVELFKAYQDELKREFTENGWAGLGIHPAPHPSGREFVGSAKCSKCHVDEYDIWKNGIDGKGGPHAHATKSLVDPRQRSGIPRHFDAECLSCHVTGWNPQEFYPYESGYLKLEDALLHGNGCENCHGPGSEHVKLETARNSGDPINMDDLKRMRRGMRLTVEEAEKTTCYKCHDLDNSPGFHGHFDKYWEQIEH